MAASDGYFDISQYTGNRPAPAIPQQTAAQDFLAAPTQQQVAQTAPAPQGGGLGLVPQEVLRAQAENGGMRLSEEQLLQVRDRIKLQHLPGMLPKGSQQFEYEQAAAGFDSAFDDWTKKYYT